MRKARRKWDYILRIFGPGAFRCHDLRYLLHGGSAGGALIWIRVMDDGPSHFANPGGYPLQGGLLVDRDATAAQHRGDMVVSTIGRVDDGRGTGRGRDISLMPSKQYIPIYCNLPLCL